MGLFLELLRLLFVLTVVLGGAVALPPMPALASNLRHVRAIAAHRLAAFASNLGHVLTILADGGAALAPDFGHVRAIAADGFATLSTDTGHVGSILTDGLSSLSTGETRLFGRELVRAAFDVSCLSPLACDFALSLLIHGSEAALRFL
jgi:hypothetical protein